MTPVNSPPATSALHARRLHVLVADDMLGNQKTAMMMLKHLGHTGMLVGDGDQALRCLAQHRFDVVLLDDHMPGMDGRQVLQALRQSERAGKPATTVIMVTANDLPGDREQYLAWVPTAIWPNP
jgi:CheY-like chemotaxis protein